MITPTKQNTEQYGVKTFEVSVNRKPVTVAETIVTGLQIKEAAIGQGIAIELGFQLARVADDGTHVIIGNQDKVDVTEFKTFFATRVDDNS